MPKLVAALLISAALLLSGCKPDAALHSTENIDRTSSSNLNAAALSAPSAAVTGSGIVMGQVRFTGRAPARVKIDMSMDPACAMAGDNSSEQYVGENGKLANVFIYIKSGIDPSKAPAGTPPVVLDQKGCRYTPHVIGVQQGGQVQFNNSDPTMHNIHAVPAVSGNQTVDISQSPMGQAQIRQFNSPELMIPVRCNNHPWMNAFINVAPNQFFTITGADGNFTLRGLPPGSYTIAAVHEKLGEQDMAVSIPTNTSAAKADFNFAAR